MAASLWFIFGSGPIPSLAFSSERIPTPDSFFLNFTIEKSNPDRIGVSQTIPGRRDHEKHSGGEIE
jgi:hypothetical protein